MLRKSKLSTAQLIIFYRQLATLLSSGVTLVRSLLLLQQNQKNNRLNIFIQQLKISLENGNYFSQALQTYLPKPDFLTCQLIHIAEQTGTLDNMLLRIANNKEKMFALKNKVQQACIYPAIILITAIVMTTIMLLFVIPRLADLFTNFHAPLPQLTLFVIHLAENFRHYAGLLLLGIIFLSISIYSCRRLPHLKNRWDKILWRVPVLGLFFQKTFCARLAHSLATLFTAGMPITDSLKILLHTTRNHCITVALQKLQLEINSGKHIHQALQGLNIFPTLLIQMVKVGEEAGALPEMLEKTAAFYEAELTATINTFTHLLEPLIILVLGVLIGGLVIAMYLPIFKLGTVI